MLYFYDLEVWQNFFSALLISEDGKDEYVFIKFGDRDEVAALLAFLQAQENLTLVSYNGLDFDEVLLRALIEKPEMTNKQIHNVAQAIIKAKKKSELPGRLKDIAYAESKWFTIDYLKLLEVNMNRPSLKHCSIHLKHNRLEDLPIAFDSVIKPADVPKIIEYNRNDVEILRKIHNLHAIKEAVDARLSFGEKNNVDLRSAGDSKITNVVFEMLHGVPETKETRRSIIYGDQLIPPTLSFVTEEMRTVVKELTATTFVEIEPYKIRTKGKEEGERLTAEIDGEFIDFEVSETGAFNYEFVYNGVKYVMGVGGLHSDDPPRKIVPEKGMRLVDADVTSYYPSMILHYELVPGHLDRRFLDVYRGIYDERLRAKGAGDDVPAYMLKIALNGLFGKLNFPGFWVYDPLAFYRVTLYGQLLLLDLVEKLTLQGIDVISANTDGILAHFHESKTETYDAVCKEWQERTGMMLEFTEYSKFVQLNVNSYLSVTKSGKIKLKKDFDDNLKLSKQSFVKGYNAPVIALSLQRYFIDDIKPEDFVPSHNDIHDFFYTQRAGQKFGVYLREGKKETKLQKTNRYFVSNAGGQLFKRDVTPIKQIGAIKGNFATNRETAILKGQFVTVLNDIPEGQTEYNINYDFYIKKVREIIDKIEGKRDNKPQPLF